MPITETCACCHKEIKGDDVAFTDNSLMACKGTCEEIINSQVRFTAIPTAIDYEKYLARKNHRRQTSEMAYWGS